MAVPVGSAGLRPRVAAPGTGLMWALAVLAAASLAVWFASPLRTLLDHTRPDHAGGLAGVSLFAGSWMLMVIATMLPTARPLIATFGRMVSDRPDASRIAATLIVGYLGVWLVSGVAIGTADLGLHGLSERTYLADHRPIVAGATLIGAGAYQLSPIAASCLRACRTPNGFIHRRWRCVERPARQAFAIGVDFGLSCFGCCAALMVVMAALGMANPLLMLGLAAVAAIEKAASWGPRLARPSGVALAALGTFLVVQG